VPEIPVYADRDAAGPFGRGPLFPARMPG